MGELGGHYAKQNRPDRERKILHDYPLHEESMMINLMEAEGQTVISRSHGGRVMGRCSVGIKLQLCKMSKL